MEYLLLVVGSIICAVLAIRAAHLLISALWLAGVSVLVALTLYLIGAREVAVIELSVGAGLVTVLFVFAISIAGDDATQSRSLVPKPLVYLLVALALLLIALLTLLADKTPFSTAPATSFVAVFWGERALDVLAQIALIFAGSLAVLGLLSEAKSRAAPPVMLGGSAEEIPLEPTKEPELAPPEALPEEKPV
jgi:NADH:ubiquinone oxidoreductase subunit 6 (subunit J)